MTQSPESPSDAIARRVQELRKRKGWSVARLAAECAAVGAPHLNANVLTNLLTRKKRRRDVTVDEAVALARALDEPVAALLGLAASEDDSEVLGQLRDQVERLERVVTDLGRARERLTVLKRPGPQPEQGGGNG